jgi:hypothetical protein
MLPFTTQLLRLAECVEVSKKLKLINDKGKPVAIR